jgi:hypothetical protein
MIIQLTKFSFILLIVVENSQCSVSVRVIMIGFDVPSQQNDYFVPNHVVNAQPNVIKEPIMHTNSMDSIQKRYPSHKLEKLCQCLFYTVIVALSHW